MKNISREKSFNEFYNKYNKKVYNFVLYRIRNEIIAEEIMQDSFLTLYNMIEDMNSKSETELKNLVMAIAKNILMSYTSKIKRRNDKFNENITEFYEERVVNPEEIIDNKETKNEIYKALSKMTRYQREALILVKLKGLSYKEAGKILNKDEEEIKQLIYRGKKSLKKILENEYPDLISRYKKAKKFTSIIIIIISLTMLTGFVYASYKVYEHFIKNPETYTLEERDMEIDESSVNITREEASTKIKENLKILNNDEDYNIDDITLVEDGIYNRTSWTLYIDNKFRIDIDANTGELIRYNNFDTEKKNSNDKNLSTNEMLKEIDNIYKLLYLNKDFKVISYNEIFKIDLQVLDVLYAADEEKIYNSILIEYDMDSQKIINLLYIDSYEQNKKVNITKEQAIEILKEYDDVESIESIEINVSQVVNNTKLDTSREINYNILNENLVINESEIKFYWEIIYNKNQRIGIEVETGELLIEEKYSFEVKEE